MMAANLTDVQRCTLEALRDRAVGPAHLSSLVWPDRQVALAKGAAPGTGLVRPMLAVLARLKKAGLVRWYSIDGAPVVWDMTSAGAEAEELIVASIRGQDMVLEGAQGALLDEWHGFHPHTTWSTTTAANARAFLDAANWRGERTTIGVIRTYATRHGAGPFPTAHPQLDVTRLPEPHNTDAGWQGVFRRGLFDAVATRYAIAANRGVDCVALTHCDREQGLGICTAYKTPRGRVSALKVSFDRDLDRQQKLGELVAASTPIIERSTGSGFEIEEAIGVPIDIESWGPTAEDKRWARRFASIERRQSL